MMLPVDMMLIMEPAFKKYVEIYAKDEDKFFTVSVQLHWNVSFRFAPPCPCYKIMRGTRQRLSVNQQKIYPV